MLVGILSETLDQQLLSGDISDQADSKISFRTIDDEFKTRGRDWRDADSGKGSEDPPMA